MSLLVFLHQQKDAWILTDTLATDEAGAPKLFTDKAVAFPSMDLIVATTGYAELLSRWGEILRIRMRARDITMLDLHAPKALRSLWDEMDYEAGPLKGTATIYHFGIDEESGDCLRFTYRSSNNFESERAEGPSVGVKPPPANVDLPNIASPEDLIQLARDIREEQDGLHESERVFIGGDLVLTHVSRHAISTARIYRFEDQYDHWQTMNGAEPTGDIARLD